MSSTVWSLVPTVLRHPTLWSTALAQLFRMAPSGWWRRRPFLPLPDAQYLQFRMETAYGDPRQQASGEDLVSYLRWCRAWPHLARR